MSAPKIDAAALRQRLALAKQRGAEIPFSYAETEALIEALASTQRAAESGGGEPYGWLYWKDSANGGTQSEFRFQRRSNYAPSWTETPLYAHPPTTPEPAATAEAVEVVARTICAHELRSYCTEMMGTNGCKCKRGEAADWKKCKAKTGQLEIAGHMQVAREILAALGGTSQ